MAKKKKVNHNNSLKDILGFDIFQNEKLNFFLGLALFGVALYLVISFVSFLTTGNIDQSMIESAREGEVMNQKGEFKNYCGSLGAYVSYFFMKECFGLAAFVIPAFCLMVSLKMMRAYEISLLKWFLCSSLIMVWSSITLAKFLSPLFIDSFYNPGGDHGLYVCQWIENLVGAPGLTAILALAALGFLTYISAETIYIIRKLLNPVKFFTDRVTFEVMNNHDHGEQAKNVKAVEDPTVFDNPETQTVEFAVNSDVHIINKVETDNEATPEEDNDVEKPIDMEISAAKDEEKAGGKDLVNVGGKQLDPYDPKLDLENYHYPTLDLLKKYDNDGKPYIDMTEQNANKNRIIEVLRNFGVEISSIKATVGPTITLYEITPAQGVRIAKIRNLEDDIALSLSALGIRIIAPIPGKGTIGIEVPNAKPNIVSMESILNSKKFQESQMELPCAVGKTITNEVFMFDLAKIPHLLVAGATGQGKSVGLNAIITSLLYKKHPAELKIVLIDPKKVEFSIYGPISNHFLAKVPDDDAEPIITDVTKVVRTLNSLCKEMDTRYDLLKLAGARNVKEYNKKFISRQLNPENGHRFMPYIVVVIDEFGDLIMTAGKEIELPIARIAQLARAVGIHMIIATQRPTTTIITGNIKANFPGRIAFKVSAMIDSKTILDRPGANQLIGRGDMLFLNGNEPVRVQCAFVDTPEVERINQFIAQQQGYVTPFELPEPDLGDGEIGSSNDVDMQHLDPLFEDTARLIVASQSGSTSLIQRKFSIGYNRAGRIMDQMEKAGIVGSASGSKPREVLIQDEVSLNNLLSNFRQ
ncbi:MAG: DNA translocase FtsK 4TM domain-containing protein [Prevotellaceae bacterium]|nr:DNA translocase FtsK 4TM domain-containing protein [Prevotellaceae bacterium]MDD5991603.1 DNA translocase FtsK 4TM domain-containing protein [Prevotellaceae bacterium]MDD6009270.1 DNA translocase FtsK 4TM domain-containing protein [Prevotellaceae bacterium]